jgi:hypothetical protein
MKQILFISLFITAFVNVFSQNLVETNPEFKSDLITFEIVDTMWIRVDPIYNVVDSNLMNEGLNESVVNNNFLVVLNQLRKEYGSNEVTLNQQISYDLLNSFEYGQPLKGVTWSASGFFYEYNYISIFEDRESSFIRYNLDVICIDQDLFKEVMNPNATQVGFYFSQNREEQSYGLAIYVK